MVYTNGKIEKFGQMKNRGLSIVDLEQREYVQKLPPIQHA